jgi:uncharacterized protein YqjF (DUF2071 family)
MSNARFLTAEWRYLAMLNYEVAPAVLRPRVPSGTELDVWKGKTFVSLVGFLFLRTNVLGIPIPFHRNFEEVNLRFYVRRKGEEGWRRGVTFIQEIVPRWAIAAIARGIYNENYVAMPMRHRLDMEGRSVEYGWLHKGEWNSLQVQTQGDPVLTVADSEEAFITEHYWGYAAQPAGGCMEYRVEHPPWRVWPVARSTLHCQVADIYGPEFVEFLSGPPSSAFLAEGSPVVVYKGVRL